MFDPWNVWLVACLVLCDTRYSAEAPSASYRMTVNGVSRRGVWCPYVWPLRFSILGHLTCVWG